MEGGKYFDDRHFDMNALQTKMTAFHILFDVYKVLSVELHRRDTPKFVIQCPTCTNGYLIKTEMQSLIDSIRECLPLNNVSCVDNEDPCRFEKLTPYCFTFIDTQIGDRNFVNGFTTQADISRLSSDSDLVPCTLRTANFRPSQGASSCVRHLSTDVKICQQRKLRGVTNRLSNRCLTEQTVELIDSFTNANDTLNQCGKWKHLDDHLSLECRYNPFRLVNISDDDKSKLSSFFTSIRDKFRYQASDRLGTFMSDTKHFLQSCCTMVVMNITVGT